MTCPLPARTSIRDLLTDLLGCKVSVTDGPRQQLDPGRKAQLAVYRFDDGELAALCVADHDLACSAGAAIADLPPEDVVEARNSGELEGDLSEFYRETVNVLSRLLNTPETPHVVLEQVHPVPGQVPSDVASMAVAPGLRVDLAVAVEGYGGGAMTLLGVSPDSGAD